MDQAPNLLRACTLVLGIFSVIIGSYAHYKSPWTDLMKVDNYKKECEASTGKTCPPRSLELYFVSIAILAPTLSILILLALLVRKESILEKVDAIFHFCAGLLLIIGGIVISVSANQIWTIAQMDGASKNEMQFYDFKIVAGALSIVNGVCYIAIGALTGLAIRKEMKKNENFKNNMNSPYAKSSSPPLN